jgi:GMC oxidoreductase/NAD(P)-binding Rossmann-like domain
MAEARALTRSVVLGNQLERGFIDHRVALLEVPLDRQPGNTDFDAIVVGSGPGGATVAGELSKRGKRVLILERGGNRPLKDSFLAAVSILNDVSLGDRLVMSRALTTGGTTAIYLAATVCPPLELFQSLGIDLSWALKDAETQLPLAVLPDALLPVQSLRLRESAIALGYEWLTSRMLVDQSKCTAGYSYGAKWTARHYVQEAVTGGAILVNRAKALRVLVDDNRATGVEYELQTTKHNVEVRRAFASKIVLAAGGAATPTILQRSGIKNIADKGFYCHPSFMLSGRISGLKTRDGFGGTGGLVLDGSIYVGDANVDRTLYRMVMLGNRQWIRALSYSRSIAMGVMIKDSLGGGLRQDGVYSKQLTREDHAKLAEGEQVARRIIQHAGGKNLFKSPVHASHVGGAVRIKEHVDEKLETEYRNLHVCDASVLPGIVNTPTLTLICLGKYLANHLAPAA